MNSSTTDFAKMMMQVTAMPRYGTGDEIASLVAYLASPESAYVTGASMSIDGGFAA
jgi:3-oxoacyl-[acyl-carrier protein] reductase